jgi:hypothetical protein
VNGLLGWHVLVILLLLLWLVPVVGIVVSLYLRRNRFRRGELVDTEYLDPLAVVAFVASFFLAPVGVLFGHVALHQIRKSTDRGWGFAVSALWIGYWEIGVALIGVLVALTVARS